jgi:Xaa-Pro aminopeptidase
MPQFGIENRINLDRMRTERVEKARRQMKNDGIGAIICFAPDNIKYLVDDTWSPGGMLEGVQLSRNVILPRTSDPLLFEWGQVDRRINAELAPWLKGTVRPGFRLGFFLGRGLYPEAFMDDLKRTLAEHGLSKEPVAIDMPVVTINLKQIFEKAGLQLVDGGSCMARARMIKTEDEINCQRKASAALDRGADGVAPHSVCSGEKTSPLMGAATDRVINKGDLIFFDLHPVRWHGYKVCYYRTFCCGKANQRQKDFYKKCLELTYMPIKKVKAGVTSAELCKTWPGPEYWGAKTWWEISESAIGHGIGLTTQEAPGITPLFSIEHPATLEPNMVVALESWYGSRSEPPLEGCRFEETGVVTKEGYEILTKWPKDEITECY